MGMPSPSPSSASPLRHRAPRGGLRRLTAALAAWAAISCSLPFLPAPPLRAGLEPVRDLSPVSWALEQADAASPHVLAVEIGRVTAGEFQAPLWYAAFRPFRPDRPRALILAGTRGGDRGAVQAALDLLRDLASAPTDYSAWDLDLLPLVNPWGFVHDQPGNAYGIDIDRDFSQFRSAEARLLRKFLREKRYDLVVELREDAEAQGFAIGLTGAEDRNAAARLIERMREAGFPLASDALFFLGPREGVAHTPLWGLRILGWFRQATLAGHLRERVSSVVCALVTPREAPLEERIAMHRLALACLLGVAEGQP